MGSHRIYVHLSRSVLRHLFPVEQLDGAAQCFALDVEAPDATLKGVKSEVLQRARHLGGSSVAPDDVLACRPACVSVGVDGKPRVPVHGVLADRRLVRAAVGRGRDVTLYWRREVQVVGAGAVFESQRKAKENSYYFAHRSHQDPLAPTHSTRAAPDVPAAVPAAVEPHTAGLPVGLT
eukprot:Selendium_serpulae@DN8200_c0_g1_i1.p2